MPPRGISDERRAVLEHLAAYVSEREIRASRAPRVVSSDDEEDSSRSDEKSTTFVSARSRESALPEPCSSGDEATSALGDHGVEGAPPKSTRDLKCPTKEPLNDVLVRLGQLDVGDEGKSRPNIDVRNKKQQERSSTNAATSASKVEPSVRKGSFTEAERNAQRSAGALHAMILPDFTLSQAVVSKLYPHQREGVAWLHGLYRVGKGGILADDMGLGKTMQCAAFLSGALGGGLIKRAIVVAPKTLVSHWESECRACGLGGRTHDYLARGKADGLQTVAKEGGVLLTTYGMVQHNAPALSDALSSFLSASDYDEDDRARWDIVICDEGHKLKNPNMLLRKQFDKIPSQTRIVISGTPIQNNLREFWALFDFTTPGLLGDLTVFKETYEKAIIRGNDKHAHRGERERGVAAAEALRRITMPYMLRREKGGVSLVGGGGNGNAGSKQEMGRALHPSSTTESGVDITQGGTATSTSPPGGLPTKTDLVVWLHLKPIQLQLYEAFLRSEHVKSVLNQTSSALAALSVVRKICVHPALLSKHAQQEIMADLEGGRAFSEEHDADEDFLKKNDSSGSGIKFSLDELQRLMAAVDAASISASCKTEFVLPLLRQLAETGHRTLLFSQSTKMLDLIQAALKADGIASLLLDGRVTSAESRADLVRAFQKPGPGTSPVPVFLLSSVVGGLGLTLTAADRVVMLDPAWNPTVDDQAVDRAYRLGQTRDVVVYRLMTCGTLEEKIYRKQVFKRGLSRTGLESGQQVRYFAQVELRELLHIDNDTASRSVTRERLLEMHRDGASRAVLTENSQHLRSLPWFEGVSDHGLLYSTKEADPVAISKDAFLVHASGRERHQNWVLAGRSTREASSPVKRAANQDLPPYSESRTVWSGAGQLSELFARSLQLDQKEEGLVSAPSEKERQAAKLQHLRASLGKQEELLGKPWILEKLADRGQKVRGCAAGLKQEIADLEQRMMIGSDGSVSRPSELSRTMPPPQQQVDREGALTENGEELSQYYHIPTDKATAPSVAEMAGPNQALGDQRLAGPFQPVVSQVAAEPSRCKDAGRQQYKMVKKQLHKEAASLEKMERDDPRVPEVQARVEALLKRCRQLKKEIGV